MADWRLSFGNFLLSGAATGDGDPELDGTSEIPELLR